MPAISVLLPVHGEIPFLERAVGCIVGQSLADLELLILANGVSDQTLARITQLAATDGRIRVERLEAASLPAALNRGLELSRGELIARMDADDWCPPQRLREQARVLRHRPDLDALGCAFEIVDEEGRVLSIKTPPENPAEASWRLCLSNIFAHGSMVMRREAITRAGGYNQTLERAQDYDLWLRLAGRIAAVPEVLYRYTAHCGTGYSSSAAQACFASECITRAWSALPRGNARPYAGIMSGSLGTPTQARAAADRLAAMLTQDGPTVEGLLAWMLCERGHAPGPPRCEQEESLRNAALDLATQGVREIYLWGAGAHTAFALPRLEAMGLEIRGIIDDALHGQQRFGRTVLDPNAIKTAEHVLISSDRHEKTMWEASPKLRSRGVIVHRLYG
ncbi:MAG: glycosyltransferase [Planctomycetota bacterium]|nr:glycosyltransferase [Planctomycetota bacterium]